MPQLDSTLLGDRLIGLFDRGDLLDGDGDELLRDTARNEFVGMVVGESAR